MNKKLLSLAVATALAAPGAAMAEAILYGKLNVSLDYASVKNVILPQDGWARDGSQVLTINRSGKAVFVDPTTGDEYGALQEQVTTTRLVVVTDPTTGEQEVVEEKTSVPVPGLYRNQDGNLVLTQVANGVDFDGWGMSSNGYIPGEGRANRLGVKGSEDLGNGLKAIYQVEFGINLNDTNNNVLSNSDAITYRNTFVGLAGDWGTALIGRHDTPMKLSTSKLDLFADTMADYNGTVGFRDLRADNVVAYISPSLSGFQLSAAIIPAGGATGGGEGLNVNENEIAGAYSIAGIFSNGPFYASLAYESLGSEHFNSNTVSLYGTACPYDAVTNRPATELEGFLDCEYTDQDATAWRVGLGLLDWNGFTLSGVYESRDGEPGSGPYFGGIDPTDASASFFLPGGPSKAELWQIQAGYAFGNNMVKAMYGVGDYENGDFFVGSQWVALEGGALAYNSEYEIYNPKVETWAIGFDHNFSKRTKAYVLYTDRSSDSNSVYQGTNNLYGEWDGFSLGMMHSF